MDLVLELDKYKGEDAISELTIKYIKQAHNNLWSTFKAEGARQSLDTQCDMYEKYLGLLKPQVSEEKYAELVAEKKRTEDEREEVLRALIRFHRQRLDWGPPKSTGGGGRKGGRPGGEGGGRAGRWKA